MKFLMITAFFALSTALAQAATPMIKNLNDPVEQYYDKDFDGDGWFDDRVSFWTDMRIDLQALDDEVRVPLTIDRLYQYVHADFNKDGVTDILFRNAKDGRNIILFMSQDGAVGYSELPSVDKSWGLPSLGDFNGDGHYDFLWFHRESGNVVTWTMVNGRNPQSIFISSVGANSPWTPLITELNDDNKNDILWVMPPTKDRATPVAAGWIINDGAMTHKNYVFKNIQDSVIHNGLKSIQPSTIRRHNFRISPAKTGRKVFLSHDIDLIGVPFSQDDVQLSETWKIDGNTITITKPEKRIH